MASPIVGRGKPGRPCRPGLKRLLVVVLDQSRTGNAERACAPRCFLDWLLVRKAIERTDVTDFATIDNEAEDLGLPAASCRATLPLA